MSKTLQPYDVALVNCDLDGPETLSDVFYSLNQLSVTIDDVFGRIEKRLNEEKNRVSVINDRVGTCQKKVELVRGSNRATTVFSTAKFPAPKTLPMYNSLFSLQPNVSPFIPFCPLDIHILIIV